MCSSHQQLSLQGVRKHAPDSIMLMPALRGNLETMTAHAITSGKLWSHGEIFAVSSRMKI